MFCKVVVLLSHYGYCTVCRKRRGVSKSHSALKSCPHSGVSAQSNPAIQATVLDASTAAFLPKFCNLDNMRRTSACSYAALYGSARKRTSVSRALLSLRADHSPFIPASYHERRSLKLTRKEFDVLYFLVQHLNQVWEYEFTRNFDEVVKNQRVDKKVVGCRTPLY